MKKCQIINGQVLNGLHPTFQINNQLHLYIKVKF